MLDLNQLPGLFMVGSGAVLSFINLHLNNVAYKTAYVYSNAQPFKADGIGTGLWPSVGFAPNSTVRTGGVAVLHTGWTQFITAASRANRPSSHNTFVVVAHLQLSNPGTSAVEEFQV